jgi:hypothetical protein
LFFEKKQHVTRNPLGYTCSTDTYLNRELSYPPGGFILWIAGQSFLDSSDEASAMVSIRNATVRVLAAYARR